MRRGRIAANRAGIGLLGLVMAGLTAGCASNPASPPSPPASSSASRAPAPAPADTRQAPDAQGQSQQAKAAPSGGDAVSRPAGGSPSSGEPASGAQTRGERQEALDEEFDRSLAVFDERLMREQYELDEKGQAQADRDAQRGGSGAGGDDPAGQGGYDAAGVPLPPGERGADEDNPVRDTGSVASATRNNLPPPPADIPSGQDDDVVARQLREAAENETDPELREKLWEEYRAYKRSNR
ncbi:MAG: hypothetical protein CMN28_07775 [Salinisphaeraceae bacterium]|nr:hypothetical protein [Salinisphaeraceae bacterium]